MSHPGDAGAALGSARRRGGPSPFALGVLALGGVVGTLVALRGLASSMVAYYVDAALQLFAAILGIVIVATGIVSTFLWMTDRLGRRALWNNLVLFLGWNLLKAVREVEPRRARARRRLRTWLRPRGFFQGRPWWLAGLVLGAAGLAWGLGARAKPWSPGWSLLVGAATGVGAAAALATVADVFARAIGALRRLLGHAEYDPRKHPPQLRRRNRVTTPTFIAVIGVAVGVWALIVVISVMSGFQSDLRNKIMRTQDHVQIQHDPERSDSLGTIADWPAVVDQLRALEGVEAAFPYVHGEVMLSSRTNISTSVGVKGIDPEDLAASHQLTAALERGGPELLAHPERIRADVTWSELMNERKANGAPDITDLRRKLRNAEPAEAAAPGSGSRIDDVLDLSATQRIFPGLLLGKELARSLNVVVGSEVQVITPEGAIGPLGVMPRSKSFRVAGIFHTGMFEFDMRLVYMDLGEALRYFDRDDTVNRIELRVSDVRHSAEILERVAPILEPRQLVALDWKTLNRSLFSALQLEKVVMFIVLGFVILVASFAIVASLTMIVMEKAREIAILKSMGTTSATISRTFVSIGLVIGVVGATAGTLLGLVTCFVIDTVGFKLPKAYYIEFIPVDVAPLEVVAIVAAAVLLCVLMTLFPSYAASRLRPVEGLRYE